MRGETINDDELRRLRQISIHSPHARGDIVADDVEFLTTQFQSTPLMRGETPATFGGHLPKDRFQSTPLMRGETDAQFGNHRHTSISIHSPHARGDEL